MNLIVVFATLLCLFSDIKLQSDAARTKEKIYVTLEGHGGCFRRLNGTHQIGCSSGRSGNVGVIHFVQNENDLDWVLDKGPHDPYTVFLVGNMFQRTHVQRISSSGKASGILTNNTVEEEYPTEFSPDQTCPNSGNEYYGGGSVYQGCSSEKWNPQGSSFFFDDYDIPIMILNNASEVEDLFEDCLTRNSPTAGGMAPEYPLCGAELKDVMDAAVDTPTCIRRSNLMTNLSPQTYCDPMGDYNVYSLIHPVTTQDTLGKLIVAATRMDSFSMFNGEYPSADSAVSGLVTMLAAAQALGRIKGEFSATNASLMFMFFNGEAFEYMGSSRMVYDMNKDLFPAPLKTGHVTPHLIKPGDIKAFIELAQIGKLDEGKLWIHTDPISRTDTDVNSTIEELVADLKNHPQIDVELDEAPSAQPLPPASLQSFLKDTQKIPGLVITDHKQNYTNKFYNSIYDVPSNINATWPESNISSGARYDHINEAAVHLTKVAQLLARTLYRQSGLTESLENITVDELDVAHLLYCFSYDPVCELFNKTIDPYYSTLINKDDFSYYVGVGISGSSINYVRHMTKQLLSYFLGDRVPLDKEKCRDEDFKKGDEADFDRCCKNLEAHTSDEIYNYVYINDAGQADNSVKCYRSPVNVSWAKSPAFDIDDYDWDSNEYPAWSESRWGNEAISVRYFLIPPRSMEVSTLVVGVLLLLCSFPIMYFINKKASVLFDEGGFL